MPNVEPETSVVHEKVEYLTGSIFAHANRAFRYDAHDAFSNSMSQLRNVVSGLVADNMKQASSVYPRPKAEGWQMRIYWISNIPSKRFEYAVNSVEEGAKMLEIMALYDLHQLEIKVRTDFSNMGSMEFCHPEITNGEWWDADPREEYGIDEIVDFFAKEPQPVSRLAIR